MSPVATARRIGAGARKPRTGCSCFKFGLVGGSGYVINLVVFALAGRGLGVHHIPAAVGAFCVAVTNNFLLEPALDLPRRGRPRRLPGRPLLHRQRRRARGQPARPRAAGRAPACRALPAQAIAVAIAMPVNFIGNKLWTFARRAGPLAIRRSRRRALPRWRPLAPPPARGGGA